MRHYERRLPHWDVVDQPLFVTFRLHNSLPTKRVFPPESLATSGKAFVAMDRLLDGAASGPRFLQRPEIAELVVAALRHGDCQLRRYQLHAFVVMPNHVHMLVTPSVIATRWLGPLKGFMSHQANELLGAHGRAFWQDESYDHLVRSTVGFERIRRYIERNPVAAGPSGVRGAVSVVECSRHGGRRLKGGCSQDWLPHIRHSARKAKIGSTLVARIAGM